MMNAMEQPTTYKKYLKLKTEGLAMLAALGGSAKNNNKNMKIDESEDSLPRKLHTWLHT